MARWLSASSIAISALAASLTSASALEPTTSNEVDWVGPTAGRFGPPPVARLGGILSDRLFGPSVTLSVRSDAGAVHDPELYSPYVTGTAEAPAYLVGGTVVAQRETLPLPRSQAPAVADVMPVVPDEYTMLYSLLAPGVTPEDPAASASVAEAGTDIAGLVADVSRPGNRGPIYLNAPIVAKGH